MELRRCDGAAPVHLDRAGWTAVAAARVAGGSELENENHRDRNDGGGTEDGGEFVHGRSSAAGIARDGPDHTHTFRVGQANASSRMPAWTWGVTKISATRPAPRLSCLPRARPSARFRRAWGLRPAAPNSFGLPLLRRPAALGRADSWRPPRIKRAIAASTGRPRRSLATRRRCRPAPWSTSTITTRRTAGGRCRA
ncbi:Hypothetical protein A7982_03669 [Minicystis rosea]|nr:Hypothetical protein A7982_03669 [Minicystis rosea]